MERIGALGMKRKVMTLLLACSIAVFSMTGCGNDGGKQEEKQQVKERTEETERDGMTDRDQESVPETDNGQTAQDEAETADKQPEETEQAAVRVGSLKGPTSIGLLKLMKDAEEGNTADTYTFTMETAADALLPMLIQGKLDIALIPANVASVLYHKTEGGIKVIDINTLGVLYMVSADVSLDGIEALKGKTVYLTGKGTTPDYVLHYILEENGIREGDITLEYKSEAAEVAAALAGEPESIGLLPQPFVTAACVQNENLQAIFDMTEEWRKLQGEGGSQLVTGVTVVRSAFLEENQEAVDRFLKAHKASAEFANTQVEETAELAAEKGIIEKAPIAVKAIPECNITYMEKEEMQAALSGYLEVLMERSPESIGGKLPEADFYY